MSPLSKQEFDRRGIEAERLVEHFSTEIAAAKQHMAKLQDGLAHHQKSLAELVAQGFKPAHVRQAEKEQAEALEREQSESARQARAEAQAEREAEAAAAREAELKSNKLHVAREVCAKCGDLAPVNSKYHRNSENWFCDRGNGWRVFMAFCQTTEQAKALLESGGDPDIVRPDGAPSVDKFPDAYDPGRTGVHANPGALPNSIYTGSGS